MGRPKEVSNEQILVAARRCFLKRGAAVSAVEIAGELSVSHTTLFNRFGSKEKMMLAALGPPAEVPWVAALEAGPDDRPVRVQLIEHATVMSVFFQDLQQGFAILQAAGIKFTKRSSGPEQAYAALVAWFERAQKQRLIGKCDVRALASTLLSALQGRAMTLRACGVPVRGAENYVERLVELLWNGISPR